MNLAAERAIVRFLLYGIGTYLSRDVFARQTLTEAAQTLADVNADEAEKLAAIDRARSIILPCGP